MADAPLFGIFDDAECFPLPLPGEPTGAAPGSEEKIRVLIQRAARREPLFHPNDGIKIGSYKPHPPSPPPRTTSAPLLRETAPTEPAPFVRDETIKAI
jgi:hypothetical protein